MQETFALPSDFSGRDAANRRILSPYLEDITKFGGAGGRPRPREVDFLVAKGCANAAGKLRVSPVEAKSTKSYSTVSLDDFKGRFGARVGTEYVLHPKQLRAEGDRVYLPLYMAHLL